MNTASLELCKELYELSGWEVTQLVWHDDGELGWQLSGILGNKPIKTSYEIPAYDSGYLIRKLPPITTIGGNGESWLANYTAGDIRKFADTPEDAAAKLCIELLKQGILK